jgi:ADP-ribose pyrophosphatase YjhB (NUDIX family)
VSDLRELIAALPLQADEETEWPPIRLRVRTYLTTALPPLDLVTSVRAVVFRGDHLLVVRDPVSVHILPGGKREHGETLLDTLRREVKEETGWTILAPRLIGLVHFHQLTPEPDDTERYPYPNFLHLIFAATAGAYDPARREAGGYEIEAGLQPLAAVGDLPISAGERALLRAALQSAGPSVSAG